MTMQTALRLHPEVEESSAARVDLVSGQKLLIRRGPGRDLLTLMDEKGDVSLTIRVTPEGPVVELRGGTLGLDVEGPLVIEADRLTLRGREGVAIESDGEIRLDAREDLTSEARAHRVNARRGNVDIRANDDVTLDGERIKMNC